MMGIFAYIPVQLVGVLRLGEIIGLVYVLLNLLTVYNLINSNKYIRNYSVFMLLWLILGCLGSVLNNTDSVPLFKGVANIIVIYTSFLSFFLLIRSNIRLLPYFLIPFGLFTLIYSPYTYGSTEDMNLDMLNDLGSEGFDNYFDIFIAPLLTPILFALTMIFYKQRTFIILSTFIYGVIAVYWDAKSIGLVCVLAAALYFFKGLKFKLTRARIRFLIIVFPLIIFPLLSILVSNDLLGRKSSEDISDNLNKTERFNPFLLIGRPDPIVGILAIADRPFFGHGFNKQDTRYTDLAIAMGFLPSDYSSKYEMILDHSCFLHSMVEGGIFAAIIWIFVLSVSLKVLPILYKRPFDRYTMIVCYSFFYMFWNVLFSPISRTETGMLLALIIVYLVQFNNIESPILSTQKNRLTASLQPTES
jgi:hypothetical protein